jgi:D-sedoheptulose 7-phosphate isomerase
MIKQDIIIDQINESIEVKRSILQEGKMVGDIDRAATIIINAYKNKKKTLLAGNGGSAADAQHLAGEFVNKFYFNRPGLGSIALTTDSSILTAIGNDYGFEKIFARQVQALGNTGDVFIGISTSGNSTDVLEALKVCKDLGIKTIGLTGQTGGEMADLCDICLKVPSTETPRIQESHILIGHILCYLTENSLFNSQESNK